MTPLTVAVVIPALNEAATLDETCRSLGFCKKTTNPSPPNTLLVIIDNGSTDGTLEAALAVQIDSSPGSVIVGNENLRGYVPPRHRGNLLVKNFADRNGLRPSEIFILQADADTYYTEGYIERMREAAQLYGSNLVVEGLAQFSPDFKESFPDYVELCHQIDERTLSFLRAKDDLLCTDAVSGYRLSDYITWGGHLREFSDKGEEIHAETTRLFMRGLPHKARKIYVDQAIAYPSQRKVISHPLEELATAGFPRESSWRNLWRKNHQNSASLETLRNESTNPTIAQAIKLRERHLLALFGILPLHVARVMNQDPHLFQETKLSALVSLLPAHPADMLFRGPGKLLTDVTNLVDQESILFDAILMELELRRMN